MGDADPVASVLAPAPGSLERLAGERTVPGLWHENYWFRRHEIAYLELAPPILAAAGDAPVVEAGCGEGYGLPLLAAAGIARIAALDYAPDAAAHAQYRYGGHDGRIGYGAVARAGLSALPLADHSAGAVVSFQVIEHLWTPWEFLAECARVLVPGGLLAVTTPNRPTFSPGLGRGEKPPNPFHVKEFDADELRETIDPHLPVTSMLAVAHGARLAAWEAANGSLVRAQLATPPDRWTAELAELVVSITATDFVLRPMEDVAANQILDLVVLAGARLHDHGKDLDVGASSAQGLQDLPRDHAIVHLSGPGGAA